MDACSFSRKSKRQKRNNKKDINCSGRTLSDLPDNVLIHIVSFLRTKEAVRTSILSKRWEYIWKSIPKLDFVQGNAKTVDFLNFVDRAFLLRGSSDITRFYLKGEVDGLCRVEAWISAAVRCKVCELKLELDGVKEPLSLPLSLVNCGTLTDLTIHMCRALKFPSPIYLSSLKVLELNYVAFPDEHSIQQLFSGCPVLEDLVLDFCYWVNVTTVSVFSPRLRNLTIVEAVGIDETSSYGCEFVILGSGLKYFYYDGAFYFDYCIFSSALLEDVYIYTQSCDLTSRCAFYRLLKLLRSISDVPNLILGSDSVSLLAGKPELLNHMPIFSYLERLELDYDTSDLTNRGLLKILQNMPCLERLVFVEGINISSADAREDGILNPVPPCFLDHLKFIYVPMKGDGSELNAVKVLLRNAVVLTEMRVDFGNLAEDTKTKVTLELMKLPRGSKDCGIYLV